MELRQLRYFIAIAEHLSFTRAAERYYVAQPALSRSIASLELELGVKLFERNQHSVRLTKAGSVFLREAKKIIKISDEAVIKARQTTSDYIGSLKIGFLPALLFKKYLPKWVTEFHSKYPNIELDLNQFNSAPLYDALRRGEIDIGFTMSSDFKDTAKLNFKILFEDRISLVMRNDNPLLMKNPISFKDCADKPFVMLSKQESSGYYEQTVQICINRGFSPNIVSMPTLLETVFILVDAGIGISLLPDSSKYGDFPDLRYITVEGDDAKVDIIIAWEKANSNPFIPLFFNSVETSVRTAPEFKNI